MVFLLGSLFATFLVVRSMFGATFGRKFKWSVLG